MMLFSTPNVQPVRFQLVDMGYTIIRETSNQIVWSGEPIPKVQGAQEVPA